MIHLMGSIRLVVVALLAIRVAISTFGVIFKRRPALSLLIPATVLFAAIAVANKSLPKPVAVGTLFVIDSACLIACLYVANSLAAQRRSSDPLEVRIQRALGNVFPALICKIAAIELTVLTHVPQGVLSFLSSPKASATSYTQTSKVQIVALIATVAILPDAILGWLLIPHHFWMMALAANVLEIWAALWAWGLLGTMVSRPHEIREDRIVLHNGILSSIEIERTAIMGVVDLGPRRRQQLPRRRGDGSVVLGFGGSSMVEIQLSHAAWLRHAFFPARRTSRIFVPSDAPRSMLAALTRMQSHNMADVPHSKAPAYVD